MIKWIKPSGIVIETNDREENIAAAEGFGWVREGEEAKTKEKPKRTRRSRAQMAEARAAGEA